MAEWYEDDKFCVNCKFHRDLEMAHRCHAKESRQLDYVTGKIKAVNTESCYRMREIGGECGPDAHLYQPK